MTEDEWRKVETSRFSRHAAAALERFPAHPLSSILDWSIARGQAPHLHSLAVQGGTSIQAAVLDLRKET
jgi:hypothetical protein